MPAPPKRIAKLLADMRANPASVRFRDALAVAEHFFGKPRQSGGSHQVFRMPWAGDPRINLQESGRDAKPYQVRQLLAAVERLSKGTDDG
jgi:hypothetical protein